MRMLDELDEERKEVARLRDGIRHECICPCCEEEVRCIDGCTFAEECPAEHERMMYYRELLAGFDAGDAAEMKGRDKDYER